MISSDLQQLLQLYRANSIMDRSHDQDGHARILVSGFTGSSASMMYAANHTAQAAHMLLITPDHESAAYLYNDLRQLCSDDDVHLLLDSFKRPGSYDRYDATHALARTEIINQVTLSATPYVIVTYPEALMEMAVSAQLLADHRIRVTVGEQLDVDTLIEILLEYGFNRTDFVYEPGQFSIRGDIIDIFSYGSEYPYRIELFDEEVEQIRLFHPMDQRSIKKISSMGIVPDVNKNFSSIQKSSFLQSMDEDTMVVLTDFTHTIERWNTAHEKMTQAARTARVMEDIEPAALAILEQDAILSSAEFIEELGNFDLAFMKDPHLDVRWTSTLTWTTRPQPEFNKQFELLIEDMTKNQEAGYEIYLFAESPKQIERFYAIFEDLRAGISFIAMNLSLTAGFIDDQLKVACYTDHQIIKRFHRYRLKRGYSRTESINLRMLRELRPGDYVTHIDHGVGQFSGLEKIEIGGHVQESVRLIYQNKDLLYVSINSLHKIAKYSGEEGKIPKLSKLGSDTWNKTKAKAKKKVKDIAGELIKLYAKRKASDGFAFPPDGYMQNELEASFIYEDTPDQVQATMEIKDDMMATAPMDRLICGDVGFGKTELAVRAAFKAVLGGKQVAILVPTTILALQHYRTFRDRLAEFGVRIDYLNRFRTTKETTEIIKKLDEGSIDLIIGTHGLLNKKIKFKDLGLLVIDEEQKFGVAAKEKLRKLKINVDTLTMTATPIPRTLQFSLMSARDMSILRTAPPNRQPIYTEVRLMQEDLIRDAIEFEVNRGGQVFFVHNRIKSLADIQVMLEKICPDISIRVAHGQMDPEKLESTLVDFIDGEFDVLLSTNIIETGLDIPNVNTIIINNAHQFGMSDLHQLRGRVGRSNRKAYCYLFAPPMSTLTTEARKRLRTLEDFSDLGSGFHIAMRDLDIRGAGNLLGAEQSGFISDIGYETYQKILQEAISELKESEFKEIFQAELEAKGEFVHDVVIDLDSEIYIPDTYIANVQERLNIYTQIDHMTSDQEIAVFREMLEDRFGTVPQEVDRLFDGLRMRWLAKKLGICRIILKNHKLRLYFVENAQSIYYESRQFHSLMNLVATRGQELGLSIKERHNRLYLVKDDVQNEAEVITICEQLMDANVHNSEVSSHA